VTLDNFLTNRQTHASAGVFIAGVQALKNNENAIAKLRFNPNPIIPYRQEPAIFLPRRAHMNFWRPFTPEFDGVANQIQKQLH
jgi:hypothetical protein